MKEKRLSLKAVLAIQGAVIVYTMGGRMLKNGWGSGIPLPGFIMFYGGQILVLAVYALLWQQIIKRVDLSVAYVNRAMAICWSMVWAILFFGERITLQNIIGVVLVLSGTIIVNSEAGVSSPAAEEKGEGHE